MIFVAKYVSVMVFGGGILGGAHKIWSNPYLNSTTILFDRSCCFDIEIKMCFSNQKPYWLLFQISH